MDDPLSLCEWPPLPPRYDQALRECVAYLISRYDVTAVIAAGTIVRGVPDPSSDFDVYVIHRADFKQRVQRFFNGVPAEMFVNSLAQAYRNMEIGVVERRPDSAHMIAEGFTVLDLANEVAGLQARGREILLAEPKVNETVLTRGRYGAATGLEDATDVAARDPATASLVLGPAVLSMLRFVCDRAGVYQPRAKDLLATVGGIDPQAADLARRFAVAGDPAERLELAGRLADVTIGVRGFFEWESEPEATAPAVDGRG